MKQTLLRMLNVSGLAEPGLLMQQRHNHPECANISVSVFGNNVQEALQRQEQETPAGQMQHNLPQCSILHGFNR